MRRTRSKSNRPSPIMTIDDPNHGANKAHTEIPAMSLVRWTFVGVLALPAAEVLAFLLAAVLLGWLWAITLFLATSALGVVLLRQSGRADLGRLRAAVDAEGLRGLHLETPGAATMLAGILLVCPGFITDLLAAGLLLPPFRRWLSRRLALTARRRRDAKRDPRIIDLEPGEWQQIPDQRRARRPRTARKRSA